MPGKANYCIHFIYSLLFMGNFLSSIVIISIHIVKIACSENFQYFKEDLKILETVSVRRLNEFAYFHRTSLEIMQSNNQ